MVFIEVKIIYYIFLNIIIGYISFIIHNRDQFDEQNAKCKYIFRLESEGIRAKETSHFFE